LQEEQKEKDFQRKLEDHSRTYRVELNVPETKPVKMVSPRVQESPRYVDQWNELNKSYEIPTEARELESDDGNNKSI